KYSSMVTRLIPRKASRTWVALANVVVSAMRVSPIGPLFTDAQPVGLGVGFAGFGGIVAEVRRVIDVFQRHLTAAQAADEAEQRRPRVGVVHGRADLGGHHARRSEEHTSELQSRGHLVCRLLLE